MKYALLSLILLAAPVQAKDIWSGVFTAAQAAYGKDVYNTHCAAACHIENLMGNGPAPGLAGIDFMLRWEDFTVEDFFKKIVGTMPKAAPGSLSTKDYVAVTAYLLSANGAPAGQTALSGDYGSLSDIIIAPKK